MPLRRATGPVKGAWVVDSGHVVVIGAGLAGLEAARRLARAGLRVSVLEREARPGGRAAGVTVLGTRFDPTGPALRTGDATLRAALAELGLADALEPWPVRALAQVHEGRLELVSVARFADVATLPGVRRLHGWRVPRIGRQLDRFLPLLDRRAPERAVRLDDRSVADYGRLYFGESVLARWIEPQLAGFAGLDAADTSRAAFLLQTGLGADGGGASLRGGIAALVEHMASALSTHIGVGAKRIEGAGAAAGGLRVLAEGPLGAGALDADAVVLATPAGVALRIAEPLLTPAERDFLCGVAYAPALALTVALRRDVRLPARRVLVPAAEGLPLAAVALTPLPAASESIGALATLLPRAAFAARALDTPIPQVEREVLAVADRIAPGLLGATVFTHLERWRDGVPRFDVGAYRALAHFRRLQTDLRAGGRRLYFAGDYLVGGSVEGALASGARAADQLLGDLARR